MKFKNAVSMFFLLSAFVFVSFNLDAQTRKNPSGIPALNNKTEIFRQGETVIAEVKFTGLDAVDETHSEAENELLYDGDFRKCLVESRVLVFNEAKFKSEQVEKAIIALKDCLSQKGYFDADVAALGEKISKDKMNLVFSIKRNAKMLVSEINFTGNNVFSNEELTANLKQCLGDSWQRFDKRFYEYCAQKNIRSFMFSRGYFKAAISEIKPKFKSENITVNIEVNEGIRYMLGELAIKGAKVFTEKQLIEFSRMKTGEVADGQKLRNFFDEQLKEKYSESGYVLYNCEFDVEYVPPSVQGLDGIVNVKARIEEGQQFRLAKMEFSGVEPEKARKLKENFSLKEGEIFNQSKLRDGIKRINETKEFQFIDDEQHIELRTDDESPDIYLVVRVKKLEK